MFGGSREVDPPGCRVLSHVQPGEANETLRISFFSCRGVGDNGEIACQFPVELHFPDRVPSRGMKEDKRTACARQSIPDGIPAANVMQFVTEDIVQFGAILLETES